MDYPPPDLLDEFEANYKFATKSKEGKIIVRSLIIPKGNVKNTITAFFICKLVEVEGRFWWQVNGESQNEYATPLERTRLYAHSFAKYFNLPILYKKGAGARVLSRPGYLNQILFPFRKKDLAVSARG